MGQTLQDLLKHLFNETAKTRDGKELLKEYDFIFQFEPTDGEPFYLEIKEGNWTVVDGKTEKPMDQWRLIKGSSEVLRNIFEGKTRLVDAVWEGKLFAEVYRTYMYYIAWLSRIFKLWRAIKPANL